MSTQIRKVAKVLRAKSATGVSVSELVKLTRLSKDAVYRRVYDLRVNEGHLIYSNYKTVKGVRKLFYRFAA